MNRETWRDNQEDRTRERKKRKKEKEDADEENAFLTQRQCA